MAGLAAAAQARSRGAKVEIYEKGDRCGGSMLLSSGVIWRHRDFDWFRMECATGDPRLQRTIFDRLDGDLEWLESLGAKPVARRTGNSNTTGLRFKTQQLTDTLFAAGGGRVRLEEPLSELPDGVPVILATGGFQANRELVRRYITSEADSLLLRATPWSTGDGLRLGLQAGGEATLRMDEFYGRNMPAPPARIEEKDFVPLAQLYAHHALVTNRNGEDYQVRTWSEIDVVQWTARQPDARARYTVVEPELATRVRGRSVAEMIEAAERAGAPVERHLYEELPATTVEVVAGITTTLGGLRIDERAQVAPGVFACGTDAGGIATGGYASGLAAALVFGRIAADAALRI
jgi:fumarate reductase flavoprotein subunit